MKADANVRPLRVLLIAPSIEILGGQAVQATRLLASLRDEPSLEVEFQPIDPRLAGPFQFIKRIKFVRTAIRSLLYSLQLIWRVPRFDVIHTFSAGKSSYVLWTLPALVVGKLWRKLFIVNYRDGQAEEHLTWKGTSTTLQMADAIVSPSDYVVKVFADHGIPAKRIFNIIDPTPFVFRQRGRLKPVFLTNRILEPLYNVECVLRAFALVQQHYPEASLTVAHSGPSRRGLERLARELCLQNMRRYAVLLIGDASDADDLVQECLLRVVAQARAWRPVRDLRAYMFATLHNVFIDGRRRRKSRQSEVPIETVIADLAAPATQTKWLEVRDLVSALGKLPAEQREVVLLVGVEGMSYLEAAQILGVALGTVMSRLSRGREALRQLTSHGVAAKLRVVK